VEAEINRLDCALAAVVCELDNTQKQFAKYAAAFFLTLHRSLPFP